MKEMTRELMEEVLVQRLKDMADDNLNDEERQAAKGEVTELSKLLIENDKVELEFADRRDKWEAEGKFNRLDRYISYGLNAANLVLPLAFYGLWMKRGFQFEKTGTFTSTTFRGLFGRFSPKK